MILLFILFYKVRN